MAIDVQMSTAKIDASAPNSPPEMQLWTSQGGLQEPAYREARDGDAKDAALREIPGKMQPDRQPQATGHDVSRGQQHSRFDRRCRERPPRSPRD